MNTTCKSLFYLCVVGILTKCFLTLSSNVIINHSGLFQIMSNHTSMQTQFKSVMVIINLTAFSLLRAKWSSFIPSINIYYEPTMGQTHSRDWVYGQKQNWQSSCPYGVRTLVVKTAITMTRSDGWITTFTTYIHPTWTYWIFPTWTRN